MANLRNPLELNLELSIEMLNAKPVILSNSWVLKILNHIEKKSFF